MLSIESVSGFECIFDDELKTESSWNGRRMNKHSSQNFELSGIISQNTFEREVTLANHRISPKGGYVEGGAKADSDGNASASASAGYESEDKTTRAEAKVEVNEDGKVSGEISVRQEF